MALCSGSQFFIIKDNHLIYENLYNLGIFVRVTKGNQMNNNSEDTFNQQ